ncbi:hypothetical protein, partial [Campylobacter fetus]|uniref:hypothetical protein n=1 Tax=Campylobacter fetus TaxID=196 RepID=UPI0009BD483B
MAFVQIPNGAKEMQLGNKWVKIPDGAKEMEIPDNVLNSFKQPKQEISQAQINPNNAFGNAQPAPNIQNAKDMTDRSIVDTLNDTVKSGWGEVTKIANSLNPFDTQKGMTNQEKDLNNIQSAIISKDALNRGTFALNPLLDSKDKAKAKQTDLENVFRQKAKEIGYQATIGKSENGETRYGIVVNGQVKDITPNFMQTLAANSGEIAGSIAGSILAPQAKVAGIASKALTPLAKSFIGGMAGSGVGASGDYVANSLNANSDITTSGVLNSAYGGLGNEALGAGLAATLTPAIKAGAKGVNATAKGIDKAIDLVPIINQLRTQNIGGAMAELENQVGGKEILNKILNDAMATNTKIDIKDGSTMAMMAKNKADEINTNIANSKANNTIKNISSNVSDKTSQVTDFLQNSFLKNGVITDGQEKLLAAARANPRIAQVLSGIIAESPEVANNLSPIISRDANKIINMLDNLVGNSNTIKQTAQNYTDTIKKDFGEMVQTLANRYDEIYTTVPGNETGANFMQNIEYLKDSVWGNFPNRNIQEILTKLDSGKHIDIKGVNDLRSELNHIIDATQDINLKNIANNTKKYIETDIMDDILNKMPLSDEARTLYKNSVKEYKDMATIRDSNWYKNVGNIDKGENSIIKSINQVLDENAPNNTVNMFLSKLNDKEVSSVELNLLKNTLDNFTAIMDNGGKVVDIENVLNVLKNKSFRSQESKGFIELLETLKPIIGQDKVLFNSMAKFKNGQQLSQGISTDPTARAHTMIANQTIKTALRLLPVIGRKPALIHHLKQAALKAKTYDGFINNIKVVAYNKNIDKGIRAEINTFLKALENEPKDTPPTNPTGGTSKPNLDSNTLNG